MVAVWDAMNLSSVKMRTLTLTSELLQATPKEITCMESRLRILVVDVAMDSMNPIRRLLPRLFSLVGDVRFFGPGYISHDVLKKGLTAFAGDSGPFDIALISEQYLFLGDHVPEYVIRSYGKNIACNFPLENLHFCPGIRDQFYKLSVFQVAFIFTDYYNMPTSEAEKYSDSFDLIIASGEQFLRPIATSFDAGAANESFSHLATDVWLNFAKKNHQLLGTKYLLVRTTIGRVWFLIPQPCIICQLWIKLDLDGL